MFSNKKRYACVIYIDIHLFKCYGKVILINMKIRDNKLNCLVKNH